MVDIPALIQSKWPILRKHGLLKLSVYQSMSATTYNTATHTVLKVPDSSHNIDVVFDALGQGAANKFQESLADGSTIKSIDRVAVFPALDLPVLPKINDLIVDPSLREWEVKGIAEDPADAHYELWVRPIT